MCGGERMSGEPALVRELRDIHDELVNISNALEARGDSEARYLIDQFNKYTSWRTRDREVGIVGAAFGLTVAAMAVAAYGSSVGYSKYPLFLPSLYAILGVLGVLGFALSVLIIHEIRSCSKKLKMLEVHRSGHRSLPPSVTFETITEWKWKKLNRLLGESAEPNQPRRSFK
jgi:hypothetical protein